MSPNDLPTNPRITVIYPHGSGGQWLSRLLSRMVDGCPWDRSDINFHTKELAPEISKAHAPLDNSISLIIDSPQAKFNFWLNYVRKRVCYTLKYDRHQGRRIYQNPYESLAPEENFLWLITQCRFIQQSSFSGPWMLDWRDLVRDSNGFYQQLRDCLSCAGLYCQHDLSFFDRARENYLRTATLRPKYNANHWFCMIWSLALLQNQGIVFDYPVFQSFRDGSFKSWIAQHRALIDDLTQSMSYHVFA